MGAGQHIQGKPHLNNLTVCFGSFNVTAFMASLLINQVKADQKLWETKAKQLLKRSEGDRDESNPDDTDSPGDGDQGDKKDNNKT